VRRSQAHLHIAHPQAETISQSSMCDVHRGLHSVTATQTLVPHPCQPVFTATLWVNLREIRKICYCDVALNYSIIYCWYTLVIVGAFYVNSLIQFYLNNAINLRHLTPHITPCLPATWRSYCDVTPPYSLRKSINTYVVKVYGYSR